MQIWLEHVRIGNELTGFPMLFVAGCINPLHVIILIPSQIRCHVHRHRHLHLIFAGLFSFNLISSSFGPSHLESSGWSSSNRAVLQHFNISVSQICHELSHSIVMNQVQHQVFSLCMCYCSIPARTYLVKAVCCTAIRHSIVMNQVQHQVFSLCMCYCSIPARTYLVKAVCCTAIPKFQHLVLRAMVRAAVARYLGVRLAVGKLLML